MKVWCGEALQRAIPNEIEQRMMIVGRNMAVVISSNNIVRWTLIAGHSDARDERSREIAFMCDHIMCVGGAK